MTRYRRTLVIAGMFLVLGLWGPVDLCAEGNGRETSPLEVALFTERTEAVVGEKIPWQISLMNVSGGEMSNVSVYPVGSAWKWRGQPDPRLTLMPQGQETLSLYGVPRHTGDLSPLFRVSYGSSGITNTVIIQAAPPVHIVPVNERVHVELILPSNVAWWDNVIHGEIRITNRSPFTLTCSELRALNAGIELVEPARLKQVVLPGRTHPIAVVLRIRDHQSGPRLAFAYTWTDHAELENHEEIIVRAAPLGAREGWWNWLVRNPVLATALLGALGWWIKSGFDRHLQEQLDKKRCEGILQMVAFDAKQAADEGTKVDLAEIKKVFSDKDLFVAMEQLDGELSQHTAVRLWQWFKRALHSPVRLCRWLKRVLRRPHYGQETGTTSDNVHVQLVLALWQAARDHNAGLEHPWGASRVRELKQCAEKLANLLEPAEQDQSGDSQEQAQGK